MKNSIKKNEQNPVIKKTCLFSKSEYECVLKMGSFVSLKNEVIIKIVLATKKCSPYKIHGKLFVFTVMPKNDVNRYVIIPSQKKYYLLV